MKDKVQESWFDIYSNLKDYTLSQTHKTNLIQQTLDCRLTDKEIKTLLHVYRHYCRVNNVPFVEDSVVYNKLKKQLELWEEEDE